MKTQQHILDRIPFLNEICIILHYRIEYIIFILDVNIDWDDDDEDLFTDVCTDMQQQPFQAYSSRKSPLHVSS